MKIKFPNTKEGIKKFLETKKKVMLDKQIEVCYNVGTTTERNVMRNGKDYQGSE